MSRCEGGFTLIEVLIVIGLVLIVASMGLFASMHDVGRSHARTERDTLVSLLTTARARALANVNESPQGLCINTEKIILFETGSYNPTHTSNREMQRDASIEISGPHEIVFEQLTGNVAVGVGTMAISGGAPPIYTIELNRVGRIDW